MNPERKKFGWAFACLCVINLVCALDATILSVALPTIAAELNGTATEAFWAGTSFLLTSTVFQPSWTSFSHIIGRTKVMLAALAFFAVGSIVCAVATTFTVLLVGRCLQGVGAGGASALTYVIVSDLVSLRERGKWFSFISVQWAIGSVTGPVTGGGIVQSSSWVWIFWLNLPFIVVGAVFLPICLRIAPLEGSLLEKLKEFDWIGSVLFTGSITSFLVPLTWGGVQFSWYSYQTLLPMILGLAGLGGFMAYEKWIAYKPLIRGSIFSTSTAIVGYFGTTIHGIILWSLLYYMPLYYELGKNYSPLISGVAIFPFTFTTAPSGVVVGLVITKTGKYRPSVFIGWTLSTLGLGLLVLLNKETTIVQWIFLTLTAGTGAGILYSAQSFAVQASASDDDLPFAAAMYSFFRAFGQTFGVAIGGVIFQNVLKSKLEANTLLAASADEFSKNASALVHVIKAMADSQTKQDIITAYVDSLRVIWIVMCALSGFTLILNLIFTKNISLDREHRTEHVFVGNDNPMVNLENKY